MRPRRIKSVPFGSRNEDVARMDGGECHRWRSFGLRELARFKELLEKHVRLKPGWSDSKYMAT
ncbi:hypothetical protein PVK06_004920 [Gossypium arboreum]|uniref:Uncharacterized protein n=1 Tax=Gossypium arboreum TaxID=29729 RepID=A0ABR0QTB3_GOSAR|nr:hypothetical protein PVK06_004920 [Gossypium arboreum]